MKIKKGDIIVSKRWPEPVQVDDIREIGSKVSLKGFLTVSKTKHVSAILTKDELDALKVLGGDENFTEDPKRVFLFLEAKRYRFASLYDPLLAMSTSKVDPLPHQIEAVYGRILKNPRIRFLIADDPGAGKTIMAGLIIKEMKLRGLAKRILIIAPGHLRDQWLREMDERFKEKFVVMSRESYKNTYQQNPWLQNNQIIASMDFAKQDDVLTTLRAVTFDLVIIDEAHKMSAYASSGRRSGVLKAPLKVTKSKRYRLGEVLSKNSEHLLFLTATPHRGDPENFRLFLDLLQPGFFATSEMLQQATEDNDNPLFIRRLKEDLRDFENKPLFLPRNVRTIKYNLAEQSPDEKKLYNELTTYVKKYFNMGLSEEKRKHFAFAQAIFQRRMASSTYALLQSLKRRRDKLQDIVDGKIETLDDIPEYTEEELEDMEDEEREEYERMLERAVPVKDKELVKKEITKLDVLISSAEDIIANEKEIKVKELKKTLKELESVYAEKNDKKILVFTESKDTLMHLVKKIESWGYSVITIHGGMSLRDRVEAERKFKEEKQIMIATEAAGEGINLQFCHLMVNFDIPWNPNRLEQRMGRIHRYGQTKEVYIVNMVAEDTREGKVLSKLFEKLETIRKHLGDKAFDVIGDLLTRDLASILVDAAINAKNMDEVLSEIDSIPDDAEHLEKLKEELLETSLATHTIDFTRIQEMRAEAEEKRLIPDYTEKFFIDAFEMLGGKMRKRRDGVLYLVEKIPYELQEISRDDEFRLSYGTLPTKYDKATFDKAVAMANPDAQFISLGHPLFEAMMRYIESHYPEAPMVGSTYIDPDNVMNGYLLFYEGEIRDGTGEVAGKRLFCIYVDDKTVQPMSPDVLWDLEEGEPLEEHADVTTLKERTEEMVIEMLTEYLDELKEDREKRANIKVKYGLNSLDKLIEDLDEKLLQKEMELEEGQNVSLALGNYERKKEEYIKSRKDLAELIEREKELTLSEPYFIGIVRVLPKDRSSSSEALAENKKKIELIGMDVTMEYERKNGRNPVDVSSSTELGFDIRSLNPDGTVARYIEVKARAEKEPVELTRNEWIKAKRFADKYYLYVVWNASSNPELHIVRDPHSNIEAMAETQVVRYKVDVNEILENEVKE